MRNSIIIHNLDVCHKVHHFEITKEGVVKQAGDDTTPKRWEEYECATFTPLMILLYTEKLKFDLLPKQSFTEEEFTQIKAWIGEKLKRINVIKNMVLKD